MDRVQRRGRVHVLSDTGPKPVVNRKAWWSIGCAAAAFVGALVVPFPGFLLAIPAITSGVHARREIAQSEGTQRGADLALYGIAVAMAAVLVAVVSYVIPVVLGR